jgi:ketosteroid isomerase-like protein
VIEDSSGFEDGDLAAASAAVQYRGSSDVHEESMWNRITIVLHRIDGAWKIVSEHTSMPIDDETMQPRMDRPA